MVRNTEECFMCPDPFMNPNEELWIPEMAGGKDRRPWKPFRKIWALKRANW